MKKLTPKEAWNAYVGNSVKLFISFFYDDGITDIKEMCQEYVRDFPNIFGGLYAQDQLDYIAKLLEQHIKMTGYDKDNLYNKKELEEIWNIEVDAILSLIIK